LKAKRSEEERIEQINKQIQNLQSIKQESEQRIESSLDNYAKGESWFTRFMRLANAIYSQRANGISKFLFMQIFVTFFKIIYLLILANHDFTLPIDEARSLVKAYNTVYELQMPHNVIEDALQKCKRGNVLLIDEVLKVLSKNNLGT